MARCLTLDEMLDVVTSIDDSEFGSQMIAEVEAIGNKLAEFIATKLEIECGPATFEGAGFAGTCATFSPATPGQPLPYALEDYDPSEPWDEDAEDEAA